MPRQPWWPGRVACASALALAVAGPAGADDERPISELSLEDLLQVPVLAAAHEARTALQAPAAVYVVTQAQIRERGYLYLYDALRDAPGFDVTWMGGLYGPLLLARGLDAPENNKIVLMFDGIVDNNLSAGTAQIYMQYALHDVERIEVIYGPASALHGANAVGALVNVVTRAGAAAGGLRVQATGMTWDPELRRKGGGLAASFGRQWGEAGRAVELAAALHVVQTRGSDLRMGGEARSDDPDDPAAASYYFGPDHVGSAEDGTWLARLRVRSERLGLTVGGQAWQHDGGQGTYGHEGFAFLNGLQDKTDTWRFRHVTLHATHRSTFGDLANEARAVWRDTRLVDGLDLYFDVPGTGPDGAGTPPGAGSRYYRPDHSLLLDDHVSWPASERSSLTAGASLELGRLSDYQLATGHGFAAQRLTTLGPRPQVDENRRYSSRNLSAYVEHVWQATPALAVTAAARVDAFHLDGDLTPTFEGTDDAEPGQACPPGRPTCLTAAEAAAMGAVEVSNVWYRLARYDRTRTTFNPRLGVVWSGPRLTLKALYGEGFRMPTVRELFSVTPSRISGPGLDPEKVRSAELRATLELPRHGFAEAGVFHTRGSNFIALAPTEVQRPGRSSFLNQFQNGVDPRVWGLEARLQLPVGPSLTVFGHYGWLRARTSRSPAANRAHRSETADPSDSEGRMPRVAAHQGLLGATIGVFGGRLRLSPRLHAVGARPGVVTSPLPEVPAVAWIDLSVGLRDVARRGLSLSLVLDNVTSADVLAPGFRTGNKADDFPAAHPEPGFHGFLSVAYDWGS